MFLQVAYARISLMREAIACNQPAYAPISLPLMREAIACNQRLAHLGRISLPHHLTKALLDTLVRRPLELQCMELLLLLPVDLFPLAPLRLPRGSLSHGLLRDRLHARLMREAIRWET